MENVSKKSLAHSFIQSVIGRHLAANARRFSHSFTGLELGQTVFGHQVDKREFEGKVVDESEDFFLFKLSRSEFNVLDKSILKNASEFKIGDTVKITPYRRRNFEGRYLGESVKTVSECGQYTSSVTTIGEDRSNLLIDKKTLNSEFLKDLINQVECVRMTDGIRTIAQAMIDYGALEGDVTYVDPVDSMVIETPPALTFKVNTKVYAGELEIAYDRAADLYNVSTKNGKDFSQSLTSRVEGVSFDELPKVIESLIDDGEWKFVKVNVIKSVKLKKAA